MKEPESQDEACDICGASGVFGPWLDVSLCGVYDSNIARCSECGFRQIRPRLFRDEIAALYPSAYFDPASPLGFSDYARQQQRHEREAILLTRRLNAISPGGRLLDVGCALGFLLDAIRRRSSWEVAGVDLSPAAADFASRMYGLDVYCGTLEEAGYGDESFDFIIQKDVLEHVARPRDHMWETHRILKAGGRVLLVTPNGEANLRPLRDLAASLGKSHLPLLDQGHLSFFSYGHLLKLFNDCGFNCLKARSLGVRRGLRALGYLPRKKHTLKSVPHGKTSPPVVVDSAHDSEEVYDHLNAEIQLRQTRLRIWKPYVYYRHIMERLDTLPAAAAIGTDFGFLLQKR